MEWVETTGRTVEEALDAALDQLGVDETDAEYEVLEEPKVGLFGRLRTEARVRARVRPTKPRAKEDRRDRRRRTKSDKPEAEQATTPASRKGDEGDDVSDRTDTMEHSGGEDVPVAEQGEVASGFLEGLLAAFRVEGTVDSTPAADEESVEVAVQGDDLGLLIGPKGVTLTAIQDLARTVVQRRTGARTGRLYVDVSGYRQRRREALERFTRQMAEQALTTKTRVVLEPMTAADRKVVHDTVNTIDGVATSSEGEEPRRRVVIVPDASM